MNVRRALPKIHFDQTLYRKANMCVFAIKKNKKHSNCNVFYKNKKNKLLPPFLAKKMGKKYRQFQRTANLLTPMGLFQFICSVDF